jgi:hypothetical protein
MKNIFLLLHFVIISFWSGIKAQDCVTFHSDFSGIEYSDSERTYIINEACSLKTLLNDAGVSGFRVHTFSFYGYNANMQGGNEAVWNQFLTSYVDISTPHLAIGKEIHIDGTFKRFWVSFNVPAQGMLNCITTQDLDDISLQLSNVVINEQIYPSPLHTIKRASVLAQILLCKCGNQAHCNLQTLSHIHERLTLEGFLNYNHLPNITISPQDYSGALSSDYSIVLPVSLFPSGKFYLTDELDEFLGEVDGNAVVHYIDHTNVGDLPNILAGGSAIRSVMNSGNYNEILIIIKLEGQTRVYYKLDFGSESASSQRGVGNILKKILLWTCKRAMSTPIGTAFGVIGDYVSESVIEYWFNNDDNKHEDFLDAFLTVVERRGWIGFFVTVGANIIDSPIAHFMGDFLNHFITTPMDQWDPLRALMQASLSTAIQACGAAVKNIPAVDKYIRNILKDAPGQPGIFKHFILYPHTLKSWKKLKDLDDGSNWARLNLDLLTKMSIVDASKQAKIVELYKTSMKINTPAGFRGFGSFGLNNIKVEFSSYGFPKLKMHTSSPDHVVKIPNMNGTNSDYSTATNMLKAKIGDNKVRNFNQVGSSIEIKINGVWKGPFTWHHHQDGSSMMPVVKDIHDAIKGMHLGGNRLMDISKNPDYSILKGFFPFE